MELTGNPAKEYSSLIVSSPDLKEGETYQLTAGEESMEITVSGRIARPVRGPAQAMPCRENEVLTAVAGKENREKEQRPGGQSPKGSLSPKGNRKGKQLRIRKNEW